MRWLVPYRGEKRLRVTWVVGLIAAALVVVNGTAAEAVDPGVNIPPLIGSIACAGYAGCNTLASQDGTDVHGHPLTEWTNTYDGPVNFDSGCVAPNGVEPQYIYNVSTGAQLGVFIDNEADLTSGDVTGRQDLVDCVYGQGIRTILVGLYPSETQVVIDDPSGQRVGTMLEWFPFCGAQQIYSQLPPGRNQTTALGYIIQHEYNGFSTGCANPAAPTAAEQLALIEFAASQVEYHHGSPYGDLVADY